jgi:transposase-like protein
MSRTQINPSEKIAAVQMYLDGKGSQKSIAVALNISKTCFQQWIRNYECMGTDAFSMAGHKKYLAESKQRAVLAYLEGSGSQDDICKKYGIRSRSQLQKWIMKYNRHEELKTSGTGGTTIMTKGRKTTFEERIDIVKYCIEHQNNYAEAAQKFQVSYQQAYTWTSKFENYGVEALQDRRGKKKAADDMSELEKLKAQNKLLEAQNRRQQMEIDFLKKLDEIERRRY